MDPTLFYSVVAVAALLFVLACGLGAAILVRRKADDFNERSDADEISDWLESLGSVVFKDLFELIAAGASKLTINRELRKLRRMLTNEEERKLALVRLYQKALPKILEIPDQLEWTEKRLEAFKRAKLIAPPGKQWALIPAAVADKLIEPASPANGKPAA